MRRVRILTAWGIAAAAAGMMLAGAAIGQPQGDPLADNFRNPPDTAKPWLWWQWINGNVTKDGIHLDLEWMKRVGLGGTVVTDVAIGVPPLMDHRIKSLSPEWWDTVGYAASESARLGLSLTFYSSPGWSETAAPWVKPEEAMKKVVWSETRVSGPGRFTGTIAQPPSVPGPFLDVAGSLAPIKLPHVDIPGAKPDLQMSPLNPVFYRDIKILAYRAPAGDVAIAELHPKITSNAGPLDAGMLMDGLLSKKQALPGAAPGRPVWVQYAFDTPQTMHALTLNIGNGNLFSVSSIPNGDVESSNDGQNWKTLARLPGIYNDSGPQTTYAFAPTKARFFRVVFADVPRNPMAVFGAPGLTHYDIGELRFEPGARVNRFEEKAGYGVTFDYETLGTPDSGPGAAIPAAGIIDLTSKLKPDGTLDWTVPPGNWIVLRLGYALTGAVNVSATVEGLGLEVDKMKRDHVSAFLHGYIDPLLAAVGPNSGKQGLRGIFADSWEAARENWTDDMIAEFRRRRGYDPTPYLPTLAGMVVGSADASDRFLWDFRRTIADLVAQNHYGTIHDYLNQRGLSFSAEAVGVKIKTVADSLQAKAYTDMPVGEFWLVPPGGTPAPFHTSDIREAASAAHVYGQNLVGAEAFTIAPFVVDSWAISPWNAKWLADRNLALGVNRFEISTGVHQPFAEGHKPGITLGPFGQFFTRNATWAEEAGPWVSYLARSSYMMQQGRAVSDIAYFYGEGAPIAAPYWEPLKPEVPEGYAYDYVSADAIIGLTSVKDGRIVLPSGQSYRVLVLPDKTDRMTLPLLQKIHDLVAAGAVLVGPRPTASPGLAPDDSKIRALADQIWGGKASDLAAGRAFGKGRVYSGAGIADILAKLGQAPDFDYAKPEPDSNIVWAHRATSDGDIFFVANQVERAETVDVSFRTAGKMPELFRPDTGETAPAGFRIENGRTKMRLTFDPYGSVFVVFRKPATMSSLVVPENVVTTAGTIGGAWDIDFPPNWGAPARAKLEGLQSWTDNAVAGIKYFSGTATYTKDIDAPESWFKSGARMVLDLGSVRDIAEVAVNGRPLGIVWKPPYRVDVTDALKRGHNHLEIKVTNNWANRMIGDVESAPAQPFTYSTGFPYRHGAKLVPSGLLGPVTVLTVADH